MQQALTHCQKRCYSVCCDTSETSVGKQLRLLGTTYVTQHGLVLFCRIKVAPLVCRRWAKVLRQPCCAWDSIRIDCKKLCKHNTAFSLLSWAQQRCSSTTAATFVTGLDTAEQVVTAVLSKMPALQRLTYSPASLFLGARRYDRIGPFGSLQPCPYLTQVYICIPELHQGHLDLLAHLKHLSVLVVQGLRYEHSAVLHHDTFPGSLATVSSLRTLHITALHMGTYCVHDSISKLSRLEELHFIDCQIDCVAAGLLQLSQLHALQISNACSHSAELVLPDLSLLPRLANLALRCLCETTDLVVPLCKCMHLTSFSFETLNDDNTELPIGLHLENLIEIGLEAAHVHASVLKEAKKLQRLFCKGIFFQGMEDFELRDLALAVPNLREMHVSWEETGGSHECVQGCILLNQLLIENCNGQQGVPMLHVDKDECRNQLPWTVRPFLA